MRICAKRSGSVFTTGRPGAGGDIYLSVQRSKSKAGKALCFRVRETTLDVLRWRLGDRLSVDVEWKSKELFVTLTRAADDDAGSLKLSSGGGVKKGGHGATMRVTLSDHELAHIFPDGEQGMTGTLHGGDTKKAVFLIKTS
jgi:hypothetical protein